MNKEKALDLKDYRSQWGVPDWRNDTLYEYTNHNHSNSLKNDQLRWEFVRRLQDYREDWKNPDTYWAKFFLIEPINPSLRGDQLEGKSVLFADSILRGGILTSALPRYIFNEDRDGISFLELIGKTILQLENDGFIFIGFNPALPESPQITRAADILTQARRNALHILEKDEITQRQIPIEHPSQLLRVLDAYNENVLPLDIGQTIYLLTGDDAEVKAHARSVGSERIKEAKTCWKRVIPKEENVLL
jgi:hypothetical protein